MKVIRTIAEMRQEIKQYRTEHPAGVIGFVPTMGYLHGGHESLMHRARQDADLVVLSIFVNPLQFGPNEDYERYPRDEERDLRMAEEAGVDLVFIPEVQEMYPREVLTTVQVRKITERLCGASRPGHFDGVCTVVSKLLHIVGPDRAYFGMKDAQQVAVIMQMVEDLNMPVEIVPCPTMREADGLALSSRNVYLNEEERRQAVVLYQALEAADEYIRTQQGGTCEELREMIRQKIQTAPLADIDYIEIVTFPGLEPLPDQVKIADTLQQQPVLAALAVRFGSTRLIDNRLWTAKGGLV